MRNCTRRSFLANSGVALGACLFTPLSAYGQFFQNNTSIRGTVFKNDAPKTLWKWSKEATYYKKLAQSKVMCKTCPNICVLSSGDRSVCRTKINLNGTLYSIAYGNPCSVNIDPVEKKPLYHYMPGSRIFSLATAGCNLRCLNCQNWEISQANPENLRNYDLFPEEAVNEALASESTAIAYTYSEATTYYEYMTDTAAASKKAGLGNLWISNGYINPEPLAHLCTLIDGANVNLKSFSDDIYKKLNGGRLNPVLETFKTLHAKKIHFEITNLVVPGYTDDEAMMKKMCHWILDNLGPDHPLHFSRFFPKYKLKKLVPTSVNLLTRFRLTAIDMGLRYVYVGNVANHEGNHTFCHSCSKLLIQRDGYHISSQNIIDSKCKFCGTVIPGVWQRKSV